VTDEQLASLYVEARAFAFLSEYEGLGLTRSRRWRLAFRRSCWTRLWRARGCGDAAIYVPVSDLPATTRALESLLFDEVARQRLLRRGARGAGKIQLASGGAGDVGGAGRQAVFDGGRFDHQSCHSTRAPTSSSVSSRCTPRRRRRPRLWSSTTDRPTASVDAVRRRADVTVIETGANLGFARANNIGIRASGGANILLLNSDTLVPPGAIDRLVAELERHPRRGGRRTSAGGRHGTRRAVVRAHDWPTERATSEAAGAQRRASRR